MPGDVAQRRLLGAPLLEAVAGLALEIDDDEVVAGQQHLTQVVVAVDADLRAPAAPRRRSASMRFRICVLLRQNGIGLLAIRRRELVQVDLSSASAFCASSVARCR